MLSSLQLLAHLYYHRNTNADPEFHYSVAILALQDPQAHFPHDFAAFQHGDPFTAAIGFEQYLDLY